MTFTDGQIDWCCAKDQLDLLKSYEREYGLDLSELESVEKITNTKAKTIKVRNSEFDEDKPEDMPEKISLFDLSNGEDFAIIASTEFD